MVSMDRKNVVGGGGVVSAGAAGGSSQYRGPDLKLFVRDVRDKQRKKRPIVVKSWSTVKDVKDVIQKSSLQIPTSAQRLYFGPLLTSGGELPNHRTLHDAGIYRSGETLLLDIRGANYLEDSDFLSSSPSLYSLRSPTHAVGAFSMNDVCISSSMMDSTPRLLKSLVQESRRGFALGLKPELVLEGSGGTYFLHDARKNKIAVFKPADEEPYAENNPRGYLRQTGQPLSLRDGVAPGEACIREVAAFLLDHNGTLGVPMTTLAEARHPAFNTNGARLKVSEGGASIGSHSIATNSPVKPVTMKKAGSFQEFVRCECTMDDISPSKIPVDEVHRIAILDIRIMNADRNSANLLVRRRQDDSLELVPIDHGYCLRSVADVSWMDWCWLDWPQLKQPLSEEMKKYVLDLDIEGDARILSERLNICQEAIDYFRASSSILKAGVKAGLSLYDIAIRCCRNDNLAEVPSMLEKLVDMASDLASAAIENERWHHQAASRALVEQLSPHPRRSTITRLSSTSSSGSRCSITKSKSSAEFLELRRDSEVRGSLSEALADRKSEVRGSLAEALEGHESPAMAQSSASSDTSSASADLDDGGEKDECDCEEWAASIIMDVAVEQLIPARRGARSGSIVSDDSSDSGLSCSPKGFWHVRPDSSPIPSDGDGSVCWSSNDLSSPRNSSSDSSSANSANLLGYSGDVCEEDQEDFNAKVKAPTVSFAPTVTSPDGPFLAPKAVVAASAFKEKTNTAADADATTAKTSSFDIPKLQRTESGMSRSKSYSALSAVGGATKKSSFVSPASGAAALTSSLQPPGTTGNAIGGAHVALTENYEAFRMYFHKFIDLVIVREMTAAMNLRNNANEHWSSHGF